MKKKLICFFKLAIAMTLVISLATNYKVIYAEDDYQTLVTEKEANGLYLKKTAQWNDTDKAYDITLESFVTETIQTADHIEPTDIVLALDVSGSMDDPLGYKRIPKNITKWNDLKNYLNNHDVYQYSQSIYTKIHVESDEAHNVYIYANNIIVWKGKYGNTIINRNVLDTFYEPLDYKINSLKNAVNNFIDLTAKQNEEFPTADHKISIVKFAGNERETTGNESYKETSTTNYTQVVEELKVVNSENADELKDKVNSLEPGGMTRTDYAMNRVKAVLDADESDRKKVVILFSDGLPTLQNDFDEGVANGALSTAYTLKTQENVTIYTIGIDQNANPADMSNDFNKFLNLMSNNYPQALSLSNNGSGSNQGYYKIAKDSDQLKQVFADIQHAISTPSVELDAESVLKDVLSDYFQFADDIVEVSTVNIDEINNNNGVKEYTWQDEEKELTTASISKSNNTITVNGFDFSRNYVHINTDGNATGSKLVVKFNVKPIDGFIGGNAVPTNDESSGIYDDNTLISSFPVPKVDVEYNYDFDVNYIKDYLGNTWKNQWESSNWSSCDSNIIKKNDISKITSLNNDYVDMIFEIKDTSNNVIAEYKITHDDQFIEIKNDGLRLENAEIQNIEVCVTITPINKPIHDDYDKISIDPNKVIEKKSYIYVYIPMVESKDKDLFLGENIDSLSQLVEITGWKIRNTNQYSDNALNLTSVPTSVQVIVKQNNTELSAFNPTEKGQTEFTYTLTNNGFDLTSFAEKKHNTDQDAHFFVNVYEGSIQIEKILDSKTDNETQGDQIFIFHIYGTNIADESISEYIPVRFTANDNNTKLVANITGLKKGSYKIEELSTIRYKLDAISDNIADVYPADITEKDNIVTCYIGYTSASDDTTDVNKRNVKLEYTNNMVNDKDLSDTDVLTNTFKVTNDGIEIEYTHHDQ